MIMGKKSTKEVHGQNSSLQKKKNTNLTVEENVTSCAPAECASKVSHTLSIVVKSGISVMCSNSGMLIIMQDMDSTLQKLSVLSLFTFG